MGIMTVVTDELADLDRENKKLQELLGMKALPLKSDEEKILYTINSMIYYDECFKNFILGFTVLYQDCVMKGTIKIMLNDMIKVFDNNS